MSLFSIRDRWSHRPELGDECDRGCLVIAPDEAAAGSGSSPGVRIITGSFKGYLRVYCPRGVGYRVEDLELELTLDQPILQLEWGKFLPGQSRSALAVLHPRKLAVYSVNPSSASGSIDLIKHYEHRFQGNFHGFNMCFGPFGGAFNRDFIAVQSCDGCLAVFEHETPAFQRYLHNFVVPGPMCYVAKLDAFITANAAFTVECFKYQNLGSESAALQSDWALNVGEPVVDLFVSRFSRSLAQSQVDIVCLTERSVLTLRETGAIRLQKRVDYTPAAAHCYSTGEDGDALNNLLVASHERSLQVYRDSQLIWAARLNFVPVAVRVSPIGPTRGFLVLLSDSCEVSVSYLGTEPPAYSVGIQRENVKELDYDRLDSEHRQLMKIIKSAATEHIAQPKDKLQVKWEIGTTEGQQHAFPVLDGARCSAVLHLAISYTGAASLTQVSASVSACRAVALASSHYSLPLVPNSSSPCELSIPLFLRRDILPSSLSAEVLFAYLTPVGEPRTQRLQFSLPLAMFAVPVPPSKNAEFLLTIDTNRSPPPLNSLFPDLLEPVDRLPSEVSRTFSSVLTVRFLSCALEATILVSKKSGRYRVQSTRFESLALLTEALIARLRQFYAKEREKAAEPFKVSFSDPLPLADYFTLIDQHFQDRVQQRALAAELEKAAQQFRLVEKRLLQRFKEKTPAPLNNLDRLSEEVQDRLQSLANQNQACEARLIQSTAALECSTGLITSLISLAFELDESNNEALRSIMPERLLETPAFGWEEQVEAAVAFALKTALAKGGNAKEAGALNLQPINEPLKETGKLKRHIQLMIDRLSKGARFNSQETATEDKRAPQQTESEQETEKSIETADG